jgi:hypothetical protein
MRALVGLLLLIGAAFGLHYAGKVPDLRAYAIAQPAAVAPPPVRSSTTLVRTVAAAESETVPPTLEIGPYAPRAAPIDPVVPPVTKFVPAAPTPPASAAKADPKPKAKAQAKSAKSATRPGFKLTCTAAQRLDTARNKCVPA